MSSRKRKKPRVLSVSTNTLWFGLLKSHPCSSIFKWGEERQPWVRSAIRKRYNEARQMRETEGSFIDRIIHLKNTCEFTCSGHLVNFLWRIDAPVELSVQTVLTSWETCSLARGHWHECDLSLSEPTMGNLEMPAPDGPGLRHSIPYNGLGSSCRCIQFCLEGEGNFAPADSTCLTVTWRGSEGNWITFLKEDELQKGTDYHFIENVSLCVKVRSTGERQAWKVLKGCDLRQMRRSDVGPGTTGLGSFWAETYFICRINHISLENYLGTKYNGRYEKHEKRKTFGGSLALSQLSNY